MAPYFAFVLSIGLAIVFIWYLNRPWEIHDLYDGPYDVIDTTRSTKGFFYLLVRNKHGQSVWATTKDPIEERFEIRDGSVLDKNGKIS